MIGLLPPLAAADDLAARVVVVANSRQPESIQLAEFYATQRGVPPANIVALPMPEDETITWREFIDQVYQPLQDELYRRGWLEGTATSLVDRFGRKRYAMSGHRISYLVVCRGVPLRIANDPALLNPALIRAVPAPMYRTEAAVDSELGLLAQSGYEVTAVVPNPLFGADHPSQTEEQMVVKVSRLDGPTFESARGLVASALAGERQGLLGRYYVDIGGPYPGGDAWLEATRQQLEELGFDGDADRTPATFDAAARFDAPVFYFGWHAGNLNGPMAAEGFEFPPGAVALHIHSFSAQTMHSATQGWCGPLVLRGVAATVGNVFEPDLQFTHHPNLLLQALRHGRNFGDAACFALPALSWQTIAIGDPLFCPFKVTLADQERMAGQLPPALAPYALLRRANLLHQQGQRAQALALLESGQRGPRRLAVSLAFARMAATENDSHAAVAALDFIKRLKQVPSGDWPLVRALAGFLATHGAPADALPAYTILVRDPAPTPEAHRVVLIEARAAAEAAGDPDGLHDFSRQLAELGP